MTSWRRIKSLLLLRGLPAEFSGILAMTWRHSPKLTSKDVNVMPGSVDSVWYTQLRTRISIAVPTCRLKASLQNIGCRERGAELLPFLQGTFPCHHRLFHSEAPSCHRPNYCGTCWPCAVWAGPVQSGRLQFRKTFLKHCKKVGLQTPINFDVQQALIHSLGPWTNSMLHFQTQLPHLPRKPVYSLSEVM